jgi:hypothetical protein
VLEDTEEKATNTKETPKTPPPDHFVACRTSSRIAAEAATASITAAVEVARAARDTSCDKKNSSGGSSKSNEECRGRNISKPGRSTT